MRSQFWLTPAALNSLPYRSASERIVTSNCSGVDTIGVAPKVYHRFCASGVCTIAAISSLTFLRIDGGVFAGAMTPNQESYW